MAQVTRAAFAASLATLIPDNTAGAISPADHRSVETDLADSAVWHDEVGTAAGADTGDFAAAVHTHVLADVTDAGTAAAADTGDFAAASHTHTLADITDAGTAAASDTGDFATAAQGTTADSAVQPGDPVSINAQTGTAYTLVIGDAGKIVSMSNASANTLTIPTNASVAFPVGTVINVTQLGAGATTIQGATGVTVNGASAGSEAISAQYKSAALVKHATDTWVVEGAVS